MNNKILRILDSIFLSGEPCYYISIIFDRLLFNIFFKHYYKFRFGSYGKNIRWGKHGAKRLIPKSVRIGNPKKIYFGDNCQIDDNCYLQCHHDGDGLTLGKGVRINSFTHIQAYSKIIVADNVLVAPFVHISSGNHAFMDISKPIMFQENTKSGPVEIGQGTWIGRGAHILGNVSIGKNCVIGAGTVVTKSYNDYSIVVGNPSRLVRKNLND